MAITYGTQLIQHLFTETTLFGFDTAINIIITLFTLLIITRDTKEWATLALPVQVILRIIGLKANLIILMLSVITFVTTNLSITTLGNKLKARNDNKIRQIAKEAGAKNVLRKIVKNAEKTITKSDGTIGLTDQNLAERAGELYGKIFKK